MSNHKTTAGPIETLDVKVDTERIGFVSFRPSNFIIDRIIMELNGQRMKIDTPPTIGQSFFGRLDGYLDQNGYYVAHANYDSGSGLFNSAQLSGDLYKEAT
jgi:hypothetical protein